MELHEALRQISVIRDVAARTEVFRGYRAATVGFSAVLGVAAAIVQAVWLTRPWEQIDAYLWLWCGVAAVSIAVVGAELWWRTKRVDSPLAMRQTWQAVEQFAPCLVAGALLTFAIAQTAIDSAWLLPSIWSTLFSLGIFASLRFLPRAAFVVAMHYLACGVLCVCCFTEDETLSPWAMGFTFGVGQTLTAGILYFTLERPHAET